MESVPAALAVKRPTVTNLGRLASAVRLDGLLPRLLHHLDAETRPRFGSVHLSTMGPGQGTSEQR